MKIGKSRKNPSVPLSPETASLPEKASKRAVVSVKRNEAPISEVVAMAREERRRVEPAPQPVAKRGKAAGQKKVARARVEPVPQPRIVVGKSVLRREKAEVEMPRVDVEEKARGDARPPSVMKTLGSSEGVAARGRAARQPRVVPVEIPAILLEPDHVPTEPAIAGPGARFALTPPSAHAAGAAPEELPESYGTEQIFLAARDPFCLFASWDLDAKQRARYNAQSASGALTIRLRRGVGDGPILLEVHTPPNSRDQFIEVGQPDTTFVAELGFHEKNSGAWRRISVSKPAKTPRDRMAPLVLPKIVPTPAPTQTQPAIEATIAPPPKPERQPVAETQPRREEIVFAVQEEPWAERHEAVRGEISNIVEEKARGDARPPRPRWRPKVAVAPKWSTAKAKLLEELISLEFRRMQQGSLEIEEVLGRRILRAVEQEEAPSSIELAEEWVEIPEEERGLAAPSSLDLVERPGARKSFWFKVNAELIIYGSTEPDARVSIGGRPIRLRADGSFSYRFALPDGAYELPVVAIARDGDDARAAELRFSRATIYSGDVGAHAQDAALKPPSPANL